ncbi:hypothetical protein PS639_06362 [Pseudomonas fluorescens]|nr:hypothetical protein PS639_06362 [Pseudomonas fluorescens]
MRQFRGDFRIRVRAREHDRVGRHGLQAFSAQQVRTGQANEHVSAFQRVSQGALVGRVSEDSLVLVQIVTAGVDHAGAVDHVDVFDAGAHAHQQFHAGDGGSTGAQADDPGVSQGFASDFQGVDHAGRGNDRGAVLVIVEDRNVALFDQGAFDLKALGGLDVFQVDATKGDGDALDGVDEGLRAFGVDFDIEYVDAGEALEQHAFAFHYRFGSQWAEVTQAKNGGAIGNDCNQVALAGVFVSQLRIAGDFAYWFGYAGAVGQRQVAGGSGGLGELDTQLPWTRMGVIFESGSFQI